MIRNAIFALVAVLALPMGGCLETFDATRNHRIVADIEYLNESIRATTEDLRNNLSPELAAKGQAIFDAADKLNESVDAGLERIGEAFNEDGSVNPAGAGAAAGAAAGAINPALAAPVTGVAFLISTVIAELQRRKKNAALEDLEADRQRLASTKNELDQFAKALRQTVDGVSLAMRKSDENVETAIKSNLSETQDEDVKKLIHAIIGEQKIGVR